MVRDQLGFLEAFAASKLGRNDRLDQISSTVKWYRFEKLLVRLAPDGAGRPPFDLLVMFKALVLQQLYSLSDAGLEEALNDRVSFRRFAGLALDVDAPDHTTLCRFRNRLVAAGLAERLFAEFDRQLDARGVVLKHGTMIDASLIEAATSRPAYGADETAHDPDARFAKKGSVVYYGYKAHVGMDQGTRLVRSAKLTPANVSDTDVADELIRFDERAVYGDKAYAKRARREMLKAHGIKSRIMHKTWGGGPPLTPWQRRHNILLSSIRAEVETIFSIFKCRMGYRAVRYVGLAKNAGHFLLLSLVYNMRRAADLAC